jgi:hypothetical protein
MSHQRSFQHDRRSKPRQSVCPLDPTSQVHGPRAGEQAEPGHPEVGPGRDGRHGLGQWRRGAARRRSPEPAAYRLSRHPQPQPAAPERYLHRGSPQRDAGAARWCGDSVTDKIRTRRLARARDELAESDTSISAIAIRFGFADSSHFSRTFKARYGVAPTDFRATRLAASVSGAVIHTVGTSVYEADVTLDKIGVTAARG